MVQVPLHPTPYTLRPAPTIAPYTLQPTPYALHPTPYTLHPTPYTLHPTTYTLHPTPYTQSPSFSDYLSLPHPAPSSLWGVNTRTTHLPPLTLTAYRYRF